MAYLFELISDYNILNKKIKEIKTILSFKQTDDLAKELFNILELKQTKLLHITEANNLSKMNVGGTEISVSTVIIIRNTIKEKIDLLTSMIDNKDCNLDKIELQRQRDKYYSEYILLTMGINRNDLTVTIE
jgi:hypothetical protein